MIDSKGERLIPFRWVTTAMPGLSRAELKRHFTKIVRRKATAYSRFRSEFVLEREFIAMSGWIPPWYNH
jgi:hypothetical protein